MFDKVQPTTSITYMKHTILLLYIYICLSLVALVYLNDSLKKSQGHIEILVKVLKNHEDALTDHRDVIVDIVDHVEGNFL